MSKQIRSVKSIRELVGEEKGFRIAIEIEGNEEGVIKAGFETSFTLGDAIVPAKLGKFTAFNADGREVVRKDLPKESVSRMVWGASRDWHGNIHTGLRRRTFEMYPREWEAAPEEHFYIAGDGAKKYVVSRGLSFSKNSEQEVLFLVNLFLETFGDYIVLDEKLANFNGVKIKKLNWAILPEGEHPFERVESFVDKIASDMSDGDKKVVGYRISTILSHKPDFVAVGRGGFHGYVVMGFAKKNLFVLESPIFGNATYVFDGEWEDVSKLTKKQILTNQLHKFRFVHSSKWRADIRQILM
ncbi:hypothetical protein [Chitinibacter sp. ZOR0017]|uniref:hypothetical protein n=1 Tax=Chitinibacter sp. ZOR0017 TaxID=1339254 RepID=UPI000691E1AB|nr:hypothetical protein [Chitinibacter sp. ZOR0017]